MKAIIYFCGVLAIAPTMLIAAESIFAAFFVAFYIALLIISYKKCESVRRFWHAWGAVNQSILNKISKK